MRSLTQQDHLGNSWPTILPPAVTQPADGARLSILNAISLAATPMMVVDGSDTATGIDWEVRTLPNGGGTAVYAPINISVLNLGVSIPALTLNLGMDYYIRARWRGAAMGPGPWSADVRIST